MRIISLATATLVLAGGILATGNAAFAADEAASLAVTVTPSTGLQDGQSVEVSATGFAAGATIYSFQCVEADGERECNRENTVVLQEDSEAYTGTLTVHRVISIETESGVREVDCASDTDVECVVVAGIDVDNNAFQAITFTA